MLCGKASVKEGSAAVHLNVYDLTSANSYAYWLGLGIYHSGVEVHGVEYGFGAHEYPTSGIFEGKPKNYDGYAVRKSILIGWTEMSIDEVRNLMEKLGQDFTGNSYNLISKNCNHFCHYASIALTGNQIPSWINRLARIGLFCHCIVPESLNSIKIGSNRLTICDEDDAKEKKSLIDKSNRFSDWSETSSESSS
ncbi:hypothetical protein M569_02640, partial [Genlisea aurea]